VNRSDAEILAGIAEVARAQVGWEGRLTPELRLVEDLDLDSLKMLTLALEVENHFRVRLDDEAGIETVGDLVAAIRERLDG
jgi:acyl carrier protein